MAIGKLGNCSSNVYLATTAVMYARLLWQWCIRVSNVHLLVLAMNTLGCFGRCIRSYYGSGVRLAVRAVVYAGLLWQYCALAHYGNCHD